MLLIKDLSRAAGALESVCVLKTLVTVSTVSWNTPSVPHITHFLIFPSFTPQIHRSKNKWKFHLKDGIMNLNGRDYVFSKAIGDAEWWGRKKKKPHRQSNRRRNSVTPSIQLTDCSISFHILQLDFISGNFESEYADKPKGLWATVQPGCHQKQSPSFAGWATYSGRGKPVNRVLSLSLFVPLPFSWESSRALESKHFTSFRCSGPGWPDLPREVTGHSS